MESTVYKFIFRYSRKEQVFILIFTLLSLPFYYASLDIPKLIVNNVLADPDSPAPGSAAAATPAPKWAGASCAPPKSPPQTMTGP